MFNRLKVLAVAAALAVGFAGLATAQNAPVGFDTNTNLNAYPGLDVSLGTPPTVTGCNTGTPVVVGGAAAGKITTVGTTTCAPTLTWVLPKLGAGGAGPATQNGGYSTSIFAPTLTGVACFVIDITTVADLFTQSATTYTAPTATATGSLTCTFTSRTITSGDVLLFEAIAF